MIKFEIVNNQFGRHYIRQENLSKQPVQLSQILDSVQFKDFISSYRKENKIKIVQITETTPDGTKSFVEIESLFP